MKTKVNLFRDHSVKDYDLGFIAGRLATLGEVLSWTDYRKYTFDRHEMRYWLEAKLKEVKK
jgi:hypothetical protein